MNRDGDNRIGTLSPRFGTSVALRRARCFTRFPQEEDAKAIRHR